VARLDEQVIEPASFLGDLARRHRDRTLKMEADSALELQSNDPGHVELIRLLSPRTGEPLDLRPHRVIFTAGAGNQELRARAGLQGRAMQRRPLHMVMVRGRLPAINGHCVDAASTRVTITSTIDCGDRVVWQIGGRVAEDGVDMEPSRLIDHTRDELHAVLPGLNLADVSWATYRVDRAEGRTTGGGRPDLPTVLVEGNTASAWPTKLALVTNLVDQIVSRLGAAAWRGGADAGYVAALRSLTDWPRPAVALPPWELETTWLHEH
jgi:hypothetical protein